MCAHGTLLRNACDKARARRSGGTHVVEFGGLCQQPADNRRRALRCLSGRLNAAKGLSRDGSLAARTSRLRNSRCDNSGVTRMRTNFVVDALEQALLRRLARCRIWCTTAIEWCNKC
jgi:hypothetical protein